MLCIFSLTPRNIRRCKYLCNISSWFGFEPLFIHLVFYITSSYEIFHDLVLPGNYKHFCILNCSTHSPFLLRFNDTLNRLNDVRQPTKRCIILIRFSPEAATLHILLASSKCDNTEKAEILSEVSRASVKTSLRIMGAEEPTRRGAERTGASLCNSLRKVRVV